MEIQKEPQIRALSEKKKRVLGDISSYTDQTEVMTFSFIVLLQGEYRPLSCLSHGLNPIFFAGTAASHPVCDLSFFLMY